MIQAHVLAVFRRLPGTFAQFQAAWSAEIVWAVAALLIAVLARGYFLSQPMRGDEAYTFLVYANHGISSLFEYSLPNNHVLNTLLIKLSTLVWGGSPAIIRLPALLAGLAAIPAVYVLARRLVPYKHAGILAACASAVYPYLILYSTNARGYTLVVLCALLLALAGLRFVGRPSRHNALVMALLSALGMLAIPVMAFPVAGLFCWVLVLLWLDKVPLMRIAVDFVLPYAAGCLLFTVIFYAPVIYVSHGVGAILSNKFVAPQPWSDFLAGLPSQLQQSWLELTRDVPPLVLAALFVFVAAGLYAAIRQRRWAVVLLLPALLIGAALVLFVQHRIPYARTWIYLIPFVLLLADAGLAWLMESLPGHLPVIAGAAIVSCSFVLALHLMSANVIGAYPDTSSFPEAPAVVEYLKPVLQPGDQVHITSTADWSVDYYFWADGILRPAAGQVPKTGRVYYVVKKSRASIESMTTLPVVELFAIGDMALYVSQK